MQGVFYRASTVERARALDLSGWVRNLPDGNVEVVARGPQRDLSELAAWLWQGPANARVTGVTVAPCEEPIGEGFSVR